MCMYVCMCMYVYIYIHTHNKMIVIVDIVILIIVMIVRVIPGALHGHLRRRHDPPVDRLQLPRRPAG